MCSRQRPAAFSLVEVAIALGIVSFALLVLVGLLSSVLDRSSEGTETFLFSNVVAACRAELMRDEWANLPTNPETRQIDELGNPARANAAAFEVRIIPLAQEPEGVLQHLDPLSADALRFFQVDVLRAAGDTPLHSSTFSVARRQ